ncbi:hypothetical protein ACFL3G_02780 [Planctomycetota bacterium]
MLRKTLLIITVTAICFWGLAGCKKSTGEKESEKQTEDIQVKTLEQYQAEAKEQINEKNMAEELDKLEKELEQELKGRE